MWCASYVPWVAGPNHTSVYIQARLGKGSELLVQHSGLSCGVQPGSTVLPRSEH